MLPTNDRKRRRGGGPRREDRQKANMEGEGGMDDLAGCRRTLGQNILAKKGLMAKPSNSIADDREYLRM